jgi:hypothetical protein
METGATAQLGAGIIGKFSHSAGLAVGAGCQLGLHLKLLDRKSTCGFFMGLLRFLTAEWLASKSISKEENKNFISI